VIVDTDRLRDRAIQLRNQAEFDLDQASGQPDSPEAYLRRCAARESVFVAYALMLVAEVVDASEDEAA
jgi:hypothetical protein